MQTWEVKWSGSQIRWIFQRQSSVDFRVNPKVSFSSTFFLHISPNTIESWRNPKKLRNTHVRSQVKRIPNSNSGEYSNGEAHWFLGWRQKQASHPHSSSQCSKFKELMQLQLPWYPLHFKHATDNRHLTSRHKYKSNPKHFNVDFPLKMLLQENFRNANVWSQVKWSGTQILTPVGFFSGEAQWFLGIRKLQASPIYCILPPNDLKTGDWTADSNPIKMTYIFTC